MPNLIQQMNPIQSRTKEIERRTFVGGFSIETRADSERRKIVGHAAIFNVIDGPDWFREQIAPGAFAESIQQDDIRALFNHDPNFILGRNTAGTLRLEEDERGLRMEIEPPDTQLGRDLLASIERGDITQASFGFQTIDASWDTVEGDDVRTLKKVRLFDVSPVTYPFYEATDVSLRSKPVKQAQRTTQTRRKRLELRRHT